MRILLAIDGSDPSKWAAQSLRERPWPEGSIARVLSVAQDVAPVTPVSAVGTVAAPLVTEVPIDYAELIKPRLEEARTVVDQGARWLEGSGLAVETDVRRGDPRHEIVDEAARWQADLIVLGSHGRTGVERILMGSVSEAVVRHAPCSVEVVRRNQAHEGG